MILSVFQLVLLLLPLTMGDEPLFLSLFVVFILWVIFEAGFAADLVLLGECMPLKVRGRLDLALSALLLMFVLNVIIGRCPFSFARKSTSHKQ